MTAITELCLTSLFLLFSQISGLKTGNASQTACESANITLAFNYNLDNDNFKDRSWYINSTVAASRIAKVNSSGSLTVEPQYSGRVTFLETDGITLHNVIKSDSGSYFFIILTAQVPAVGTATTTVNIYVNPNISCKPIIEKNSADNITCKIPVECPGKDSIRAIWDSGSVGVFTCPSPKVNTKYQCCAEGDPVSHCYNGRLCAEIECEGNKNCERELGCGIGLGLGIPCVITCIIVVIFICKGDTYAYKLGLLLGLGFGITFQVSWIIIVSLIYTGNQCKLELGLALGLSSGIPCVIAFIIAVIFIFVEFKGFPSRVNIGKGIITGLLIASVIGIIVVYLLYEKLKADSTDEEPEEKPTEPNNKESEEMPLGSTDKKNKTKHTGPPAIHIRTQNRVESEPTNKKTSDRPQPLPSVGVVTEDRSKHRPQPPPPENSDVKDPNKRGISANFDDKQGLPTEPPRSSRLPPLTPKQPTVEEEDASKEKPKKKRKNRKKKGQTNEETQAEEMEELQNKTAEDQFDGD